MPKRKPPATERALAKDRPKKPKGGPVYQLKITLKDVKPPIWRRIQTQDCTLAELHDLIQISMGWTGSHLHVFEVDGEQYGLPEQWDQGGGWGEPEVANSRKLKLSQVVAQGLRKVKYVYDMGDDWDHIVQVEKTLEPELGVRYPRCTDGKRARPPEDCGGAWGYADFLAAIGNPKHERHAEMMEWIGRDFDSEEFDLDEVNKAFQRT